MTKVGEEYERAVFQFIEKLDPTAEVIFDHHVQDVDTGRMRQCDVWINAKWNIYPITFYVSCKEHNRKIHEGDIDAFIGEMHSRGANNGIIYSKHGFTKHALDKARVLGISCCRLFSDEPAEIPSCIFLNNYACCPSMSLEMIDHNLPEEYRVWNDVLDLPANNGTILDVIEEQYLIDEQSSVDQALPKREFPCQWIRTMEFIMPGSIRKINIKVIGWWRWYEARFEATTYNGSLLLNDNTYLGTITGPVIDIQGADPGPDWTLITDRNFKVPDTRITTILSKAKIRNSIREVIGPKRLDIKIQESK